MPDLPVLDRLDRPNQHYDIDHEAVADPNDKHGLGRQKEGERTPKSQLSRKQKPSTTAPDIGDRINDRIAEIAERYGLGPVTFDDNGRIFGHLPYASYRERHKEPPGERHPRKY